MPPPFTLTKGTLSLSDATSLPARMRILVSSTKDGRPLHDGVDISPDGRFAIVFPTDPRKGWKRSGIEEISFVAHASGRSEQIARGPGGKIAWRLKDVPLEGLQLRIDIDLVRLAHTDRDEPVGNLGELRVVKVPLAFNARGADVAELQSGLGKIGYDVPSYEHAEKLFGVGTRDALLRLQAQYSVPLTGVFDDATYIALARASAEAEIDRHRVEGRILLDHGLPAGRVAVRLYHRGFGGRDTLLKESMTDERGYYELAYKPRGRTANLEMRVVGAEGKEVSISTRKLNAAKHEVLNLVAPAAVQPLDPEYHRLAAAVGEHLDRLGDLAGAREDEEHQDLSLLHRSTGWDARLIAMAAMATQRSAETGIPEYALYGLFRVGLPTDKNLLARTDLDTVEKALGKARKAGVINPSDAQIAATKTAFDKFARTTRRTAKATGALSSFGELLDKSGLDGPQDGPYKDKFEALYFAHRGTDAELWEKAKDAGIPQGKIDQLRLQGKLAYLTVNNADLAASLRQEIGSPETMARLVDKGLHREDTWIARMKTLAGNDDQKLGKLIPPAYGGSKVEERLAAYASDLARKVRLSFPMQVVGQMIGDEQQLGKHHGDQGAMVASFLQKATTLGFVLGQKSVDAFVRDHRQDLFQTGTPESVVQETLQSVRRLQRLYQTTPSNEALQVAYDLGFTSAYEIASFPHEVFIDRFGKRFRSIEEAGLVHRKAQQINAVTYSMFTTAKSLDSTPSLYAIAPPDAATKLQEVKNNLIQHYPTMESLFGSLDFCDCEHCRSVLSPAAYLVDLLQFIDPEDQPWQSFVDRWQSRHGGEIYMKGWTNPGNQPRLAKDKRPYDALIERRPDLPHLSLTCENTHTALPYIDVVNEILEYYVAKDGLDRAAAYDTGTATTPELLAEPQNVLSEVYDTTLKQARYPLTLPFDLWIETVRRFFNHFEIQLWQVLDVFRPSDELFAPAALPEPYYRADIFFEQLGLSRSEVAILTHPNPLNAWFGLYGYATEAQALTSANDTTGQRVDLNSAKALSRRLGVTYKEVVDLVRTWFVNPRLDDLALLGKLGIEIGAVLQYKDPASTAEDRAAFEQQLASASAKFGFDARGWLDAAWLRGDFKQVLVLADPDAGCDFDKTTLRYADGAPADALVFLRLNLFVRLWRKLGWTIEEIDRALQALVPKSSVPLTDGNIGAALRTALVYLAHLTALRARIEVGKDSRLKLLTLWSKLATTGKRPFYEQLFLGQSVLKSDPVFDHPLGKYLQVFDAASNQYVPFHWDPSQPEDPATGNVSLESHLTALQSALNLTADEVGRILVGAGQDPATTALTLDNVSLLYRHGLLAKALKLSVSNLVALMSLSGLDPFAPLAAGPVTTLAADHPFRQTLGLLDVVDAVRVSGLKVEDLDYLLRHRFDPVGKYRSGADAPLALVSTLATEIRRVRTEMAMPADAAFVTDDWLRQQLALALPRDVVDIFFGMWTGSIEYTAPLADAAVANTLVSAASSQTPPVQVVHDPLRQQLTFRGVLVDSQRAALATQVPSLTGLLDGVRDQAKTFFERQLAKHVVEGANTTGFLDADDFDGLFTPVPTALNDVQKQDLIRTKRTKLVQAFLPYLQQRLIQQLIGQTLTATLEADPALMDALLTDAALLTDPSVPGGQLLDAFAAVADQAARGVTATFFASSDGAGAPLATMTLESADTAAKIAGSSDAGRPPGANSARFEGYFNVPVSGPFRFYATLETIGTGAVLRFDHLPDAIFRGNATADDEEISQFLELKAGALYRFTLDAQTLGSGNVRLEILGEGLPRGPLGQLVLHADAAVERLRRAYLILSKALQIVQSFGLNAREVSYLLTHAPDFDQLALSDLPTRAANATDAGAKALFQQLLRLAGYVRLRRDLAGGTDDLISIFENARRVYPADSNPNDAIEAVLGDLSKRVADLARREESIVRTTAVKLGFTAQAAPLSVGLAVEALDFATERGLARLWSALQVVEKLGAPVDAIARWATPAPDSETARDLRDTVKARYEPENWQRIAPSIYDNLRQRKRDALVAFIIHKNGFDRIEQLFEFFLIDPGMEPVVQTSRLRLAISSVQTFIQRCLLNLEPNVLPAAILNAERWQWMKRYRVWEANRKIFLFPENWLEPEWRDDKTHLFQELEGALLQGDVSKDLVEDAFFRYLKGLDVIARLEIVTTHLEQKDDPVTNVLHVVGRTYGRAHKYFYRRYTKQMWTPWEPVAVDIEGDHVAAVVWRDRLHLFWVTFLEKTSSNPDSMSGTALNSLPLKDMAKAALASVKTEVKLQLHWSEYFQGEWTIRASTGFDHPHLGSTNYPIIVDAPFDRRGVFIHVSKEYDGDEEGAVRIHLTIGTSGPIGKGVYHAFRVVSKNSQPTIEFAEHPQWPSYDIDVLGDAHVTVYNASGALRVKFIAKVETEDGERPDSTWLMPDILAKGGDFSLLMPGNPIRLITTDEYYNVGGLLAPFFYQDHRSTFYVEPALTEVVTERWEHLGLRIPLPDRRPDDWWKDLPIEVYVPPLHEGPLWDPADPYARFEVGRQEDWITSPTAVLEFGGRMIGPQGGIDVAVGPAAARVTGIVNR